MTEGYQFNFYSESLKCGDSMKNLAASSGAMNSSNTTNNLSSCGNNSGSPAAAGTNQQQQPVATASCLTTSSATSTSSVHSGRIQVAKSCQPVQSDWLRTLGSSTEFPEEKKVVFRSIPFTLQKQMIHLYTYCIHRHVCISLHTWTRRGVTIASLLI